MRRHNESMRTTIDLDPSAHKLAKAIARQRHVSLGRVISDAILNRYDEQSSPDFEIGTTELGLPAIYIGRPITREEVAALIEEE